MFIRKLPADARLRDEPAMPAMTPAMSIARYRILITWMPTVRAADGFSPLDAVIRDRLLQVVGDPDRA